MLVAQRLRAARQRHVNRLGGHARLELGGGQDGLALLERRLEAGTHLVGELAHDGALLGRELAHAVEHGGELALLARHGNADLVEGAQAVGSLDGRERAGLESPAVRR